ncbi:MAG TPA: tetratricopeptide repeat protein [Gemmataceae bacterium]|nr:tetratricopeptide repeat protein [Gemmataceae bacterium]
MARGQFGKTMDDLFRRGQWERARKLLRAELAKEPDNHWLWTQLGVTFYEQRRYREALPLFLRSRKIVPDCPLTLWNLAGTLDALGKRAQAARIYTWLLQSEISPKEDPCWENNEWAEALKADCLYRLGVIRERRGRRQEAEKCYRQYLDLLLLGVNGSYTPEDVTRRIRALHPNGGPRGVSVEIRKAARSTLRASNGALATRRPRRLSRSKLGGLPRSRSK